MSNGANLAPQEIRIDFAAVSYTHLDVYKRQTEGFSQTTSLSMGNSLLFRFYVRVAHKLPLRGITSYAGLYLFLVVIPVSYTHLTGTSDSFLRK